MIWVVVGLTVAAGLVVVAFLLIVKHDIEADFNPTREHLERYNGK